MVIDTLELDIIVDNNGATKRINNTTKALKNLHKVITDINSVGGVNGAINNGGGGTGSSPKRASSSGGKNSNLANRLSKSLNIGSIVAKLYFVRNITKQLGQDLAKVVQYGIDYEETLNLWQVAMDENISKARTFISEMNKAYGISSATVMNYQATFKNMLSALGGISEDTAYGLSEALSQMALDYASLYNTSIESAMTKFQAVLAGQVRPIRSESGYDITEQTLFQLYQQLGGTKSVRQLDQMEKRLLRVLAVYKQMQGTATGDLAKTITSSANQLRVMKEQAVEFATWIGVSANLLLEESQILVTINAYLYAATALAKEFATYLGYVEKDYTISQPIEEANTALDDANEKVEELKGKLLGFDKFQVLSSAQVSEDDVDLATEITKAIEEYERILGKAENPAFQKSLELLEAWGVQLDENGSIVGGFENIFTIIQSVDSTLGNLFNTFVNISPIIVKLLGSLSKFVIFLDNAIIGVITSLLPIISSILEPIQEALEPISEIIGEIGLLIKNLITSSSPLIKSGLTAFLQGLTPILKIISTIAHVLNALISRFLDNKWVKGFIEAFSQIGEFFTKIAEIISYVVDALVNWSWGDLGKNLKNLFGDWSSSTYGDTEKIDIPQWRWSGEDMSNASSLYYTSDSVGIPTTQNYTSHNLSASEMENAVATGVARGLMSTQNGQNGSGTVDVYVDGQKLFNITRGVAKRNGYDYVKV